MAVVKQEEIKTLAHVGCAMCGQHMFFQVDATFFYHDNGARTYEFTATEGVAGWYSSHINPYVKGFHGKTGFTPYQT